MEEAAEDAEPTISAAARKDDNDPLSALERALRDQEEGEGDGEGEAEGKSEGGN